MTNENPKWDYKGYWNCVVGDCRTPANVVKEFSLSSKEAIDQWLTKAEGDAWAASGTPKDSKPREWAGYHEKALNAILGAADV